MKVFHMALKFDDGPEPADHVAFGKDKSKLPVYRITGRGLVKTAMFFPSCLKFAEPELRTALRHYRQKLADDSLLFKKYGKVLQRTKLPR